MSRNLMFKQYDSETKAVEGERALNVTITTPDVDRSGDVVEPGGARLTNFKKNPVVLMSHDYSGLPIARAENLAKSDNGITAKVIFPEEGTYPLADTVYNLYKQKFMKAWSIGFIPIKSEDITDDDNDSKSITRGKRFKTWELLEFSACAVPCNPHALTNMLRKGIDLELLEKEGFIEIEEGGHFADKKTREILLDMAENVDKEEKDIVNKPEETDDYIRIPAKGEEGKHKGHKIRTITVSEKEGIKGIYCIDCKKIITYVFDKSKGWTMEKAKKWMADHGKTIEDYFQKVDWDTEYEVEDIDYEELEKDIFQDDELENEIELFESMVTRFLPMYLVENKQRIISEKLYNEIKAVELKAGAVLNAKNKSNLKQAQNLIQSVLDSAGATEEDSVTAVDDKNKDNKGDDDVFELVTDTVDSPVIDEEKDKVIEEEERFKAKIEEIINQSMVDNRKYFNDKLDYVMGRVAK